MFSDARCWEEGGVVFGEAYGGGRSLSWVMGWVTDTFCDAVR